MLAFFFASSIRTPNLANKIVVIDDPISSLDDHRSLTTMHEIRRLMPRTAQVVVLSHNKPFLCNLWEGADPTLRSAFEFARDGDCSNIRAWDVTRDMVTEHDRRHAMLRDYLAAATPNNREVAAALRPVTESFLRVAYPAHFPAGSLIGQFRNICVQRLGTPQQILNCRHRRIGRPRRLCESFPPRHQPGIRRSTSMTPNSSISLCSARLRLRAGSGRRLLWLAANQLIFRLGASRRKAWPWGFLGRCSAATVLGTASNDTDALDLAALLERHDEYKTKVGCSVDHFEVMMTERGTPCFRIVRRRRIGHGFFLSALRDAAAPDPQAGGKSGFPAGGPLRPVQGA